MDSGPSHQVSMPMGPRSDPSGRQIAEDDSSQTAHISMELEADDSGSTIHTASTNDRHHQVLDDKDAILEAAVDTAADQLRQKWLLPLFTRTYLPALSEVTHYPGGILGHADNGAICYAPAEGEATELLRPILEEFSCNLQRQEARTGVSFLSSASLSVEELMANYAQAVYEAARYLLWIDPRVPPHWRCRGRTPDRFVSSLTLAPTLIALDPELREHLSLMARPPRRRLDSEERKISWCPQPPPKTVADLKASLVDAHAKQIYTCGGSVDITDSLTVRYDDAAGVSRRIFFDPMQNPHNDYLGLDALITACEEATFGFQGQNVLDRDYRKAFKLDPAHFSCNFHPSNCGILDSVIQLMLPYNQPMVDVRAELYMLNVYGMSGKFKPHVDTPRSETQFASLVVCLPCAHEGGQLVVRNNGRATSYDWGLPRTSIEWAAFFSDCEHEVLEVTKGFRVTLTYNLHFRIRTLPTSVAVSIEQLPLYNTVKQALRDREVFLPGSIVGFHCQHAYPRSRHDNKIAIEICLKGIDRALLLILQELGLQAGVRPVIDRQELGNNGYDDLDEILGGDAEATSVIVSRDESWRKPPFNAVLEAARDDARLPRLAYDREYNAHGDADSNAERYRQSGLSFDERLEKILTTRRIKGLEEWKPPPNANADYVGSSFEVDLQEMNPEGDREELFENWAKVYGIQWLNEATVKDLAMAYIAYGNQAEMAHYYASAAIIARIPPTTSA